MHDDLDASSPDTVPIVDMHVPSVPAGHIASSLPRSTLATIQLTTDGQLLD
jgi:hypothetical protein